MKKLTARKLLFQKRNKSIAALYLEGKSLDEAGAPFGLKREMVRRIITAQGIVQRFHLLKKRKPTAEEKIRKKEIQFWNRAALTADTSRCWIWQANIHRAGHPRACWNGQIQYARRVAWLIFNGREPANYILNICGNSTCVNPNHLIESLGNRKNRRRQFSKAELFRLMSGTLSSGRLPATNINKN